MRMQPRQFFGIVLLLLLVSLFTMSCGEKKEASKAPVISKKIIVQKPGPTSESSNKDQQGTSDPSSDMEKTDDENIQTAGRIYDPKQRLNPFTPVFGGEKKPIVDDKSGKRKKRVPQTPLERIGLDQLKLVAIIRASTGNRALVEDTVGKGYIIKNGTYIGLNSGLVTQINADSVIVEEELENLKGEMVLQSSEIKLQKPAGE